MPRMSGSALSLTANSTSANVVAGQQFEFLQRPSMLRLLAVGSAAGLNTTLLVGGRTIINDQPISGANRFPTIPDDIVTEEGGRAGERILLMFRNTTGGTLTVNWAVDVTAVG